MIFDKLGILICTVHNHGDYLASPAKSVYLEIDDFDIYNLTKFVT